MELTASLARCGYRFNLSGVIYANSVSSPYSTGGSLTEEVEEGKQEEIVNPAFQLIRQGLWDCVEGQLSTKWGVLFNNRKLVYPRNFHGQIWRKSLTNKLQNSLFLKR